MKDDLHFADNHRDLCMPTGPGAGFQFEFYCECCNDTWRSPFQPYTSARASGWMQEAGGLLGNLLGAVGYSVDNAVDGLARAGWGSARDEAFRQALAAAKQHFNRCAQCHDHVCAGCWNADTGLCRRCAPDLAASVQTARHQGQREAAMERAREAGAGLAGQVDVQAVRQLVCPACHAETRGAKFCPQCGHALAVAAHCSRCNATLPAGSRFCPECGQRAAGDDPPGMPPAPSY
jgi:hypothetical protein